MLLSSSLTAVRAEPIIIDNTLDNLSLDKRLEYLEDRTNSLDIADISGKSHEWTSSDRDRIDFGYTTSAYWFRFSVNNTLPKKVDWYLEIDYLLLENIDFYIPLGSNRFREIKTGTNLPFHSREVVDRNFVFHLEETPGRHTYLIRIRTTTPLGFSLTMRSEKANSAKLFAELPIFWMYYGLMAVLILYNFFIFFSVKNRIYRPRDNYCKPVALFGQLRVRTVSTIQEVRSQEPEFRISVLK
ncbi:MAG: hypothetical protein GY866_17025 [Proteobacteria bacterium]|nr:hypothetical protein [Pseudomonadota bacterium]